MLSLDGNHLGYNNTYYCTVSPTLLNPSSNA